MQKQGQIQDQTFRGYGRQLTQSEQNNVDSDNLSNQLQTGDDNNVNMN